MDTVSNNQSLLSRRDLENDALMGKMTSGITEIRERGAWVVDYWN